MTTNARLPWCIALALAMLAGCGWVLGIEPLTGDNDAAPVDGAPSGFDAAPGCVTGSPCDTGSPCEIGKTRCTDGVATCVPDGVAAVDTVCRAAAGPCDVAEFCDGESTACPADALAFTGAECRVGGETGSCTGLSVDCLVGCTAGVPCDTGRGCELGEIECSTGEPRCVVAGVKAEGVVCRVKQGDCDVVEACDGVNPTCPADGYAATGSTCRVSAGDCDLAEQCSGQGPACPSDARRAAGYECRPTSGMACDLPEQCDGASPLCPADVVRPDGFTCRGVNADEPCDVGETCDGISKTCPSDAVHPSGFTCRGATGACDVAEACDGTSKTCPPNASAPNGTTCGEATGCSAYSCFAGACVQTDSCDIGEHCCDEGCIPDDIECQ